ncbi:hypothetical protein ACMXYO_13750 [Neptuniibacter sp. QD37_6]|uniref:hypothetical protein n=1 Tax=Neptuniibacter sp. QD37_6 TaxID=3398210 RepID=UPI0039F4A4E3
MNNWATPLGTFFGEDSWQFLAVALIFGLLAVVKGIADFAWSQKDRRITHLKNALEIDQLSEDVKFVLTEDINRSLFMKVTGIPTDQYTRQVYVDLLKKSEGDLTINQLRRGSQFLSFEDKKITVSNSSDRKFGYFFEKWYPWVLILSALAQVIVMIFSYNPNLIGIQCGLGNMRLSPTF